MLNYEGLDLQQNTIAMMDSDISGYRKYDQKFFESSAALNLDFGAFAPALQDSRPRALQLRLPAQQQRDLPQGVLPLCL